MNRQDPTPDQTAVTAVACAPQPLCWLNDAVFFAAQHGTSAPITLAVAPREIVVVSGGVGGGASLVLLGVAALATLRSGEARVAGRRFYDEIIDERIAHRDDLVLASIDAPLLSNLTVQENLILPLVMRGEAEQDAIARTAALLDRFELGAIATTRPAELPQHQHRAAILLRALLQPAALLLLDAPERGLTERGLSCLRELMAAHVTQGGGVLLSTEREHLYVDVATRVVQVSLAASALERQRAPSAGG